jgi:aminocarboxymuconate-semialdehyde decarboxylase
MVVDVHAHHVPPDLLAVDRRFREVPDERWGSILYYGDRGLGPLPPRLTELSMLLADMDERGVDVRAICNASWLTCYWAEPAFAADLARATNELLARAAAEHPGRIAGLASVPLQDVERAVAELEHAVGTLGLRGVAVGTNVNGTYLDDPRFDDFFAAAERLDVPVFFHPDSVAGADRLRDYYLVRTLGNPHEVAIAIARLVLGGVLERHRSLKLCFPLGGGSVPYLLGRIERTWSVRDEARERVGESPAAQIRRCYFDTILHSSASLRFLLDVVPAGQVVLGSDYPWDMGEADPAAGIRSVDGVAPGDLDRIAGSTAAGLLGLTEGTTEEARR